jgi:hypothetical protein
VAEPTSIQQVIEAAHSLETVVAGPHQEEMRLLIKDLEEAKTTLFIRTAEAKPMVERCWRTVEALKEAGPAEADKAENAFADFEQAVGKLRNTILVRTQRAT